jgi:hypothetical protein
MAVCGSICLEATAKSRIKLTEHTMIILTRMFDGDERVSRRVYAIYWPRLPAHSADLRHYLVVSDETWSGLTVATEDTCEVVDGDLGDFVLHKGSSGRDMLVHWAAVEDALLDRMIDHEEAAMSEFRRRLKQGRRRQLGPSALRDVTPVGPNLSATFVSSLASKFENLLALYAASERDNFGEILPHLVMAEFCVAAVGDLQSQWVSELFRILETNFSEISDDPVSNVIAVSFVEHLPPPNEVPELLALLGSRMLDYYRTIYEVPP